LVEKFEIIDWYLLVFCYAFVETLQEAGAHKRWASIFPDVASVQVNQTTNKVPHWVPHQSVYYYLL
jgi:hypothetical protein